MLECASWLKITNFSNHAETAMGEKRERDYIARHEQIIKELAEMANGSESACFSVARIAARLGMDQRTVRAHLRIAEADRVGAFVDAEQKQFCTREGIIRLAKKLGLKGVADE
jgi:DNA-binding transcriptional ArsR family regulator